MKGSGVISLDFSLLQECDCCSYRKEVRMSQKKIGRPVSPDSKHTMFRVRLDDTSMAKLEECAKELKITRSDVVRKGIEKIHDDLKK
jgi:hypothetical protein